MIPLPHNYVIEPSPTLRQSRGDEEILENKIDAPLMPVRMLNEFTYCPRLMYLEWVEGEWRDNYETVDGRFVHRRVDEPSRTAPSLNEEAWRTRAITLSSPSLGLIAKLDLVEGDDGHVSPVEYKRGKTPSNPNHAFDPERVQVAAQVLILRDQGFDVEAGYLYFAVSHERVRVVMDTELTELTHRHIVAMRTAASSDFAPPVLIDSPKCPKCSLVGICLPDETALLQAVPVVSKPIRRLIPSMDIKVPVYLTQQGTSIGKSGERLVVREHGTTLQEIKMMDIGHVAVFGNVQLSTQAIQALCASDIPITYFSSGGWFYGHTQSHGHKNILLRQAQFRVAEDQLRSLELARQFVVGKIANCRTILRRNATNVDDTLIALKSLGAKASQSSSMDTLLGLEGAAAAAYFARFSLTFKGRAHEFDWQNRNRRPPRDPVNAMLSLGYALLSKVVAITCQSVGLDPYLGFYHQPKYGKPALALDLMEEFRPIVVDSVVLTAINTGEMTSDDFISRLGSVALTERGRKTFIGAFERRMNTEIMHPLFGYKISYRRILEVQTRLLTRFLMGEIDHYVPFRTR